MNQFDIIQQIAELKLKEKNLLSDLEKDILDTLAKIQGCPFDRDGAIFQIIKNNGNYPEIFATELTNPRNTLVNVRTLDNPHLLSNLQTQLEYMVTKRVCNKFELKTERLIIREASHQEAKQIIEQNNSDLAYTFISSLSEDDEAIIVKDINASIALITRLINSMDDENIETYGAWKKNTLIGSISLVNVDSGTPEIQIAIVPKYQNKGYGHEFLSAVMEYVFEQKRFSYAQYTVIPNNKASIALVESVGAFLIEPKSEVEKLLIRTYHISKLSMDAFHAHRFSSSHKPELEKDEICGCFCCGKIFSPSEITDWIIDDNPCDRRGTAICPYCDVDSVIGESSGYPITDEFMKAMKLIWFKEMKS